MAEKDDGQTSGIRAGDIERWLVDRIAQAIGAPPTAIGSDSAFETLGIGSTEAVSISGELEELLGRRLSQALLYEHCTIADLACALAEPAEPDSGASHEFEALAAPSSSAADPICLVGMACRFPGADDPSEFWAGLLAGADASAEVPMDRWDAAARFNKDPDAPGTAYTTRGAFVEDLAGFDAAFFGLSPREALRMDPQQRQLLEVSWEALEDAGLPPEQLRGSRTGVFIGMMAGDQYASLQKDHGKDCLDDPHYGVGSASSVAAGRISYLFDLRGPSLTVDTACSSSLVALHLAVESLERGDCDRALVGGVSATSHPDAFRQACKMRMLAADGRCKTFDAAADGFLLGEGCGVVVVERLSEATLRGHQVLAVVRGTATNQDGASNGLTAPSRQAQTAVIREALGRAGAAPTDIGYVETHGSGTALGDAIEIAGLREVFARNRDASRPLILGAVKTNIGHLIGAAGMAGLIKTVLVLKHGRVPANLHLSEPSQAVDWQAFPMLLPDRPLPWPDGYQSRLAGVSSFGWSGSNAHVVLEQAPEPSPRAESVSTWHAVLLSAKSPPALAKAASNLLDRLGRGDLELPEVAWTTQTGRSALDIRVAVVADGLEDTVARLREVADGRIKGRRVRNPGGGGTPVSLLLPGTGDQYPGMGRELYERHPVFRAALERCAAAAAAHGVDILSALYPERPIESAGMDLPAMLGREAVASTDLTSSIEVSHAAVLAVDYACAMLFESLGIRPATLIGYSLGEYAAACLAGVLSVEDAVRVVIHRARLIRSAPAGAMLAVALEATATAHLLDGELGLAAANGPMASVVSGSEEAIRRLELRLEAQETACRRLPNSHAMHSAQLEPLREQLVALLGDAELRPPQVPVVSNLTGEPLTAAQAVDPRYWADQMCHTVRFDAGIRFIAEEVGGVLLEAGSGQLSSLANQICAAGASERGLVALSALPSPHRGVGEEEHLVRTSTQLWVAGVRISWPALHSPYTHAQVSLPTYPFEHQRFWPGPAPLPVAEVSTSPDGARITAGDPAAVEPAAAPAGHVQLMTRRWTPCEDTWQDAGSTRPHGVTVLAGDDIAGEMATELAARLGGHETVLTAGASELAAVAARATAAATGPVTLVVLGALERPEPSAAVAATAATLAAWGEHATGITRVLVATRGAFGILDGEPADPAQAAAGVLPVVANQEYLNLNCQVLDLDPAGHPAEMAAVLAAAVRDAPPVRLAGHRLGRWYLPEYVQAGAAADGYAVRPGGGYLITGGLGSIGPVLAGHLLRRGAGRIVLTGRTELSADPADPRAAAVDRLRAQAARTGATIEVAVADVTDTAAMRALFTGRRIDGVLHAAAAIGPDTFVPLRDLDTALAARSYDAKAGGAQVLAALFADLEPGLAPDWCLAFSSTSALLGGLTFGGYAAANAALTAVAASAAGPTRWLAASFDTWSVTLDRLGALGATMTAHAMTDAEALAAVDDVLRLGRPDVIVAAGGLADRLPTGSGGPDRATAGPRFPRPDLAQPYAPPRTATERALAGLWSDLLGIDSVGARDNFFDLGGNSLIGLQMLALAGKRFGVSVPSVTLFEAPTVQALAARLDERVAPSASITEDERATSSASITEGVALPAAPARTPSEEDQRIAIVGMAGRFPGAEDVAAFWRNLCDGVESITFFTPEELREAGVDPAEFEDPSYVPARAVLEDIAGFDAAFFGISPRMAAITDPQQRLFLEVCWEALEQAGYPEPGDRGRVGVFGGANISTYLLGMTDQLTADADVSNYEVIMGNDKDALTTTVSYALDLRGPSMAVQTFCSTSLAAVHTAIRSLRAGECEMALAGGVSIRVPDRVGHRFAAGGQESPDGHVRTFDAAARGSVFGDGAAVVALKRLRDALRDGDHVFAVIRGSALNNDGALKVGYAAPSVIGQARVVSDALADAGVTAADVGYVEAHGTATELGDPIEMAALTRAFGPLPAASVRVGSVKTNIGHLDRAAGVAGLIKTALVVNEGVVPATLHYTTPNPEIDFEGGPFVVNAAHTPWPVRNRPRIAGLNSLGMGGTNVHVVVEEPPARAAMPPVHAETGRRYQVLPVSARTATAADEACARLGEALAGQPDTGLADLAFTLQAGRKTFEHRRVAVVSSIADASAVFTGSGPQPAGRVEAVLDRPVAFLLAGVGEQYPGMVGELYRREPVFRAALDECLTVLADELPGTDLHDLLTGPRGGGPDLAALLGRAAGPDERAALIQRTEIAQPLMFAVDYALATTLIAWGVRPRAMLGYSLGEYVAACLAGVLSLTDALALVAYRARLIASAPTGAMLAVPLPVGELAGRYRIDQRGLDVAAVNGSQMTVIAGPAVAAETLADELRRAEIPCRPLQTTHAFHSRMLAPLADDLTAWVAANVTLKPPAVRYLSNVTGRPITDEEATDPGYWGRHMCRTVQFADCATALLTDPDLAIVEIGPGPSLGALIRSAGCPPERWPLIATTLPAAADSRPADAALADCLARLWLCGADVDWPAVHGRGDGDPHVYSGGRPGRIPLPTYPFQRKRYWIERSAVRPAAPAGREAPAGQALPEEFSDLPRLPEERWLSQPVWRQAAATGPAPDQPGSWLVYAREGRAQEVLAALRAAVPADGVTITVVTPGTGYACSGEEYTVRPGNLADTLALLRGMRASGRRLERVVHLWTLDCPDVETVPAGLHTLVALARAAGESGADGWTLDVVSAGAHDVLGGEARPAAATVTGPCLVIPLEYPGVTTRLIDAGPETPGADIVAELRRPRTDPTVALRRGRRWLQGYEVLEGAADLGPGSTFRDEGVYLITGGLGGIALGLAGHLARDHRARLVLLGRNGLPARDRWPAVLTDDGADEVTRRRIAAVMEIEALGGRVEVVTGDVADPAAVRRAILMAKETFGALHGVLHTAGVPGTGLIQFKLPEDGADVLAPKIAGTQAIAQALRIGEPDEVPLDFLVLFGSIASATGGGPGQVDYCAANAFLDGYAHQQTGTGRRVVTIDWGEWVWNAWEAGLGGYDEALADFFRWHRAEFGIAIEEGWRVLRRVLAAGVPQVVVSTQDLPTVARLSAAFTLDVVEQSTRADTTRHPRPELLTPYQEPTGPTQEAVAGVWRESLKLERIGSADNFFELGGNSLIGVSIVSVLRKAFPGARLAPHILYEAPTVAAMARYIDSDGEPGTRRDDSRAKAQLRRSGIEAAHRRRTEGRPNAGGRPQPVAGQVVSGRQALPGNQVSTDER
ncbi:acyltransferase domain-containing protein [Sphaerisporangium album]|uniref:Acyltransferase domain-containing protein n=1 Tax=Sphaerisporangium album TaxID=509200 RepID=A0A367F9Y2_9ACTN|nr:type I polyketide synthase [Sphaerisporangium album]RCG26495.1 acyltransferase domain-containing protein [Sphaerisporangium album]